MGGLEVRCRLWGAEESCGWRMQRRAVDGDAEVSCRWWGPEVSFGKGSTG